MFEPFPPHIDVCLSCGAFNQVLFIGGSMKCWKCYSEEDSIDNEYGDYPESAIWWEDQEETCITDGETENHE
jgi:hypothetical protein